jgi:hypothetical protein
MTDIVDDIYRGICIVHAYYEGIEDMGCGSVEQTIDTPVHKNSSIKPRTISKSSHIDQGIDHTGSNELKKFTRTKNTGSVHIDVSAGSSDVDSPIKQFRSIVLDDKFGQEQAQIRSTHNFLHDFNNFLPDRYRILRGSGYVRIFNDKQYVITCNHIMVKYASYVGYCTDTTSKIVKFNMVVYQRIPEIDIVIMEIVSPLDNPLPYLPVAEKLQDFYGSESDNKLVSGEFIPQKSHIEAEFKTMDLNHDIHIMFDVMNSNYIHHIPLLNLPIYEMDVIKKIAYELKINLKTDMKITNPRRHHISRMISETLSGTSGSIVRSNDSNIGMCCLYTDTENGLSLKALPIFLIDIIVNNIVGLGYTEFMGVQVDTHPCEIEYLKEHMQAHYVVHQSCNYINGKKAISFNEGDVIIEVDGKQFNQNRMLHCDAIDMDVPLNTYLMINSNVNPKSPISIKISKQSQNDSNIRIHNLSCIPYNDMFYTRITSKICCRWNNLVFMDLSEELIMFYRRLGICIMNGTNLNNIYSTNNEKIVILFNYNKMINDVNLTKEYYTSMPCFDETGHYFFQVNLVGNKKINSVSDLTCILDLAKEQNQKKITFKLSNNFGITKVLKISV